MKINWGTGLVIGMLTFVSFIMYFVVTMLSNSDYDYDLVVEDYYKAELHYQREIDAEENALALDTSIRIEKHGSQVTLIFPKKLDLKTSAGIVSFYRPSNKKLDFKIPFSEIQGSQLDIPQTLLAKGRWNLKVSWEENGRKFLFKQQILY